LTKIRRSYQVDDKSDVGKERYNGRAEGHPKRLAVRKAIIRMIGAEDGHDCDIDYICIPGEISALLNDRWGHTMYGEKYDT
jgi:hypothetical protein